MSELMLARIRQHISQAQLYHEDRELLVQDAADLIACVEKLEVQLAELRAAAEQVLSKWTNDPQFPDHFMAIADITLGDLRRLAEAMEEVS